MKPSICWPREGRRTAGAATWSTPSGTDRAAGQPAVPGDDELRPGDLGGGLGGDHGGPDEGINFFDTANVYGWKKGEGVTEQILGRWFAKGGGRRDKVVLATKVFGSMGDWPNENKLSALNIRRACEGSLRRMQTDHIDLYQMHHVDRDTPWDEIWQAMDLLVQQGKVLYVGRPTSPAGTSSRPTRRPAAGTRSAWSASSRSTTWPSARSSWRCCRPAATTGSAIPGARCRRAARRGAAQGR